jgi:hypothetical protein
MKFTYRGVDYENNTPALEFTEGEVGGKYRGANWNRTYVRHIPVPPKPAALKYRGAEYCLGDPIDAEAMMPYRRYVKTENHTASRAKNEVVPNTCPRHTIFQETSQTHRANVQHNLERRLELAKAKGDEKLVLLLEAEAKQLA